MKAIIRKITMKKVNTKDGRQFDKIRIECDCIEPETNRVRTRAAEMSLEYAKDYFNYCGISSKQAIGMEVSVTMQKRAFNDANGELRTFEEIKYVNFLDENGNAIIMNKKEECERPF